MLRAAIRNMRGCERGDLEISRIALIAGDNGAGKSSVLRAVGCALAGQALILPDLGKKGAALLVRSGAQAGRVTIADDGGSVELSYPMAQLQSQGDPPHASAYASGLGHVLDLDDKQRAKVLADYLKTTPTRADLALALADATGSSDAIMVDAVWQLIDAQGWDGAHARAKEDGARLKGQWEAATNARYGSRIAASWTPEGWTSDLEEMTPEELGRAVADARQAVEAAVVSAALSQAEIDRLEAGSAGVDALAQTLADAEEAVKKAEDAEADAKTGLDAAPRPPVGGGMPCPHCGALVNMKPLKQGEWQIEKAETLAPDELKRRREAFATADGRHTKAKEDLANARRALRAAEEAHRAALLAQKELTQARQRNGDADAVQRARDALALAEARTKMVERKIKASDLHDRILTQVAIVETLAPDGVRRTKLVRVLELFNQDRLVPLSNAAGWKAVALADDLGATYGGRPYVLLSTSEQYRVRVVLQIAMALIDGSQVVLIDGADILSPSGRNGLFGLLAQIELPSVVAVTIASEDRCPDLGEAGIGQSYWIADGVVRQLSHSPEATRAA